MSSTEVAVIVEPGQFAEEIITSPSDAMNGWGVARKASSSSKKMKKKSLRKPMADVYEG